MTYIPPNPNGQATMANSAPVVIASNQSPIDVEVAGVATEAKQDTIIGHVDGIETAIAATNTKLDTVNSNLVDIETAVDSLETSNNAIQTAVEALDDTIQSQGAVYTPGPTQIISGVRQDAGGAPSGVVDGDVHPFLFNEEGRLKVSAQPAIYTSTTGNITANGQTASVDVTRASNLMIQMVATSLVGHNVTFEGSIDGGTTWIATQVVRTNANTVELTSGVLAATPAYGWEASVNAFTNFRVRATAHTSGTASWRFLPGAYATEPIPAIQTHPVTMTSTTITSVIPTTAATALGKARDSAIGATDTGVANLMVRRDTPTAETPAAGDYVVPQVSNLGAQYVTSIAHVNGGATPYKLNSAATTNATSVKASAGQVYTLMVTNTNAAVRYLKLYNKASAPTVGTDVPVQTYAIPGATTGGGFTLSFPVGMAFSTGIALATTTEATDAGTTGVAANDLIINMTYL